MIHESIQWAAQAMGAKLTSPSQNASFQGVSTDTRELKTGELFFCLMGERDGHEFAETAQQNKAAALVMDQAHRPLAEKLSAQLPILVVADTLLALGDLAHAWRKRFSLPLLALTGSNGKTTTKELIRSVLETKFRTLATEATILERLKAPMSGEVNLPVPLGVLRVPFSPVKLEAHSCTKKSHLLI